MLPILQWSTGPSISILATLTGSRSPSFGKVIFITKMSQDRDQTFKSQEHFSGWWFKNTNVKDNKKEIEGSKLHIAVTVPLGKEGSLL